MEGIPVKISEKYKPPRKITLPASVQNKLNAELKLEKYDFQLERFVIDQMAKLKEQQKKMDTSKLVEEKPVNITKEDNISNTNILTPVPLKPHVEQSSINHQQVIGSINISDFENDTSSPFDSVELKTLNDMEELAHVLGSTGVSSYSGKRWPENGSMLQSWAWGTNYSHQTHGSAQPHSAVHPERDSTMKPAEKKDNKTMLILDDLKKHIAERKAAACLSDQKASESTTGFPIKAGTSNEKKVEEKKRETLPNPFPTLSTQSQALARRIAEMGFPLSRTSRATDMFGPNEGKVIEFMLEVQSLEESGYQGEQAERALVICKYSRDDAVKFLESMRQIMRLGFNEEEVISALIKTGFDRDKALDTLIS